MNPASGALLSLAFILGLLSTASLDLLSGVFSWEKYRILAIVISFLGIVIAIALPRFWRTGPRPKLWLAAALITALAPLYFNFRVPQPVKNDISQFIRSSNTTVQEQVVTIQGKVENAPRLTNNQRGQFLLEAKHLNEIDSKDKVGAISKKVSGKLYVTVPILQATGIFPGENISLTGVLYKPKQALNPGAFDFGNYLARQGVFAGFTGRQVNESEEKQKRRWGWWILRQRIVRSQIRWLGSPEGPLLSSIVIGSKAVDIPKDIRDQFIKVGLAHSLAASGFQISLIVGCVLVLTRRFSAKTQWAIGTGALVIFVCLTGFQPSMLRAAIMGFGALIALLTQRQVKPLGSLLVAATLLLLFNPLWIWDLGFQLSFLATLGLLVTVPLLMRKLDWLPPVIAALIAVPIAATLWTLPLQLYVFSIIAPYSIAANILSSPIISLLSIGGFISAGASIIWPTAGSAIAWLLMYPTKILIGLVQVFNSLPGNSVAVGTISLVQLLLLYALLGMTCIFPRVRRRWWLAGVAAVALVAFPVLQNQISQFQVTVLATSGEQVLVIQDKGSVSVVNSGEADTASFAVLPFLQKQGVNQIDVALSLDKQPHLRSGWPYILQSLPIKTFYDIFLDKQPSTKGSGKYDNVSPSALASAIKSQEGNYQSLSPGQKISVGATPLELIQVEPAVLQLQIRNLTWLLLGEMKLEEQQQLVKTGNIHKAQVLCWSGKNLSAELLDVLSPQFAIASSDTVDLETAKLLRNKKIQLYWTGRDGAIQWSTKSGFGTTLEDLNKDVPLL
jgi:competence protein ComEC